MHFLLFFTFLSANQTQTNQNVSKLIQEDFGKCGLNLFYSFQDNILTITGEGEMYDYEFNLDSYSELNSTSPWDFQKKSIRGLSISS